MDLNYLFGRPVRPARPSADGPRQLFILGAYPSALHVRWTVEEPPFSIQAVAVDNEPEPFWAGEDELKRIEQWRCDVSFRDSWGHVEGCGRYNGSSGCWLNRQVLKPLGLTREQAWITDCLDIYFQSKGAAARLREPAVQELLSRLGITPARLLHHPGETEIVKKARAGHLQRLRAELRAARPEQIVTLGNAALRVLEEIGEVSGPPLDRLAPDPATYGRVRRIRIAGHSIAWLPLAHPGAPGAYRRVHAAWVQSRMPAGSTRG